MAAALHSFFGLLMKPVKTRLQRMMWAVVTAAAVPVYAQQGPPSESAKLAAPAHVPPQSATGSTAAIASTLPAYIIGPGDILSIVFWRDKDMSADVLVRPDGHITLPLLNDIEAAGSTPSVLRERILTEARRYLEDPSPTVVVKEIHSRQVYITGQVEKPGPYPITMPTTVLQLIAMAGGLKEYADGKNILVTRADNGRQTTLTFDYQDVLKRKNFRQNIELKPGDTVVVP
jgi:polysaccharide biosynthesis/export protein